MSIFRSPVGKEVAKYLPFGLSHFQAACTQVAIRSSVLTRTNFFMLCEMTQHRCGEALAACTDSAVPNGIIISSADCYFQLIVDLTK